MSEQVNEKQYNKLQRRKNFYFLLKHSQKFIAVLVLLNIVVIIAKPTTSSVCTIT